MLKGRVAGCNRGLSQNDAGAGCAKDGAVRRVIPPVDREVHDQKVKKFPHEVAKSISLRQKYIRASLKTVQAQFLESAVES